MSTLWTIAICLAFPVAIPCLILLIAGALWLMASVVDLIGDWIGKAMP